jgi:hypothetical protein
MTQLLRNALPILARWLHSIALALWLGGLLAIGAFVAPTAFWVVRNNSFFTGKPALQAQIAGGIVGGSLRPFGVLCDVCAILLLASAALLWPSLARSSRTWTALGMAITLILLCTSLYQGFSLFPTMDAAQTQGNTALFDVLHHRYETISTSVQFPLLFVLALLAALRDGKETSPHSSAPQGLP